MANIWEKAETILARNLNSGLSYLITTVLMGILYLVLSHSLHGTTNPEYPSWKCTFHCFGSLAGPVLFCNLKKKSTSIVLAIRCPSFFKR